MGGRGEKHHEVHQHCGGWGAVEGPTSPLQVLAGLPWPHASRLSTCILEAVLPGGQLKLQGGGREVTDAAEEKLVDALKWACSRAPTQHWALAGRENENGARMALGSISSFLRDWVLFCF